MTRGAATSALVTLNARLQRISNVALGAAAAIITTIIIVSSFVLGLLSVVDSSRLQTRVLAEAAAAALMFQDQKAAQELLQSVHNLPSVEVAVLYTNQGQAFAQFAREGQRAPQSVPRQVRENIALSLADIELTQPVSYQNQDCGILQVRVGLGPLYRRTALQVLTALVAVLVALILSRTLLRRLNASVLQPIFDLTGLMDRVSAHADYSVRGGHSNIAELDALASGFNDMLEQIKQRDRSLAAQRDHLEQEVARSTAILGAIPDLLFELDAQGNCVDYRAPRSGVLCGPAAEFLGKNVAQTLPPAAAEVCMAALKEAQAGGMSNGKQIELPREHATCWLELSVSRKSAGAGHEPRFIFLARDVTERRSAEQKIRQLAYFDALTELPNRQSFLERIDREIVRSKIEGARLGILFLDLDGFKNVNDTMGHHVGDQCLKLAANRLREGLRPTDMVSRTSAQTADVELARLGGDEFTALLPGITHPEDAWAIANRLRESIRRPFELDGREIVLTASVGIGIYPEDGQDALALLKSADTALYHAKDSGRDNCQFYSASLTERAVRRMDLASDLRRALERGEFRLVYQPQFDVQQNRYTSVEALLRWERAEGGTTLPMDFIPLAEENGSIVPIGEWILRSACEDAVRWQQMGNPVRVAVNLSPVQLRSPNLLPAVLSSLAATGLAQEMLELEITEGAVMEDDGQTLATLRSFRETGVRVALDDFGTGYSSMSYLKRMPLNTLKVDRSFVSGLPDNAEDRAIVQAILLLAKSLGFSVTAEGVETVEQARALMRMGCNTLQGYYFSKPVPPAQIPELLAKKWPAQTFLDQIR